MQNQCKKCASTLTHEHECDACHIWHVNCTTCGAIYLVGEDGGLMEAPRSPIVVAAIAPTRLVELEDGPVIDRVIGASDSAKAKEGRGRSGKPKIDQ